MRRFYGFLLLIISTLLIIVCGFNPQREKLIQALNMKVAMKLYTKLT